MIKKTEPSKYETFKDCLPQQFNSFQEKIFSARINFYNGKKKKKGLSLEKASKKIGGISPVYLYHLENGMRKSPSAAIVRSIECAYGFIPGELADLLKQKRAV